MTTEEQIVAEHREATRAGATHRALAEIENRLYESFERDVSGAAIRFLPRAAGMLGHPEGRLRARYEIRREATVVAEQLWDRIESGNLTLFTAAHLLRRARRRRKCERIPYEDAVGRELECHDAELARLVKPVPEASGHEATRYDKEPTVEADTGAFMRRVRIELWSHIASLLGSDVPEIAREELREDFARDLDSLLEGVRAKAGRLRRENGKPISRARLRGALRKLHLDPPKRGQLPDLKAARRQQRILARQYHPDHSAGDTTAQYQAVIEAYDIVDQYVRENRRRMLDENTKDTNHEAPHLRVVPGGKE